MDNNKFGLVPVDKIEIVDTKTAISLDSSPEEKDRWGSKLANHTGDVLEIAKTIVNGKVEIAKIQAVTDNQVRILDKELDKIWLESNSRIKEMEKEGKIWADKFEKKKQLLQKVLTRIERNPEWDSEQKTAVIKLAEKLISQ